MRIVTLAGERDFDGWRAAARALALAGVPPEEASWQVGESGGGLLDPPAPAPPASAPAPAFSVPRAFLTLAETVIGHDDPDRFALLYAMLVRLRARPGALDEAGHPLVRRLEHMAKAVRRARIGKVPGADALAAWEALLADARGCTRCHLYKHATRTVFGEGPLDARILFVGEQPGDQEDLAGRPFVGPAGQLFDRALGDAGVDRARTYVTNAVKHFKFELRGRRRIHQKPQGPEIEACRWWIEQERALIRPAVTVALGVTAARSIFGKAVTITAMRGRAHPMPDDESGGEAWVTVHPSFLLRIPDENRKRTEYARFVEDLTRIAERAGALG